MTGAAGALSRAAAVALILAASSATALEPRYDHREQDGLALELLHAHDTVAVRGRASDSSWRPALRLAYGFDATGEGDELVLGVQRALRSWDDPGRERVNLSLDLRYRTYFGTEQVKTFLDLGLWAPIRSRVALGPLVGIGLQYDFSRATGVYVAGGFASAFGGIRAASFSAAAGAQLRL